MGFSCVILTLRRIGWLLIAEMSVMVINGIRIGYLLVGNQLANLLPVTALIIKITGPDVHFPNDQNVLWKKIMTVLK